MDFDREIDYLLTSSFCTKCKLFRGQDSHLYALCFFPLTRDFCLSTTMRKQI